MRYTVEYFIKKFEAIPEENWTVGEFSDDNEKCFCALGHCGFRNDCAGNEYSTPEGDALYNLFKKTISKDVADVNDGNLQSFCWQETPKQRILAALKYIKALTGTELEINL